MKETEGLRLSKMEIELIVNLFNSELVNNYLEDDEQVLLDKMNKFMEGEGNEKIVESDHG